MWFRHVQFSELAAAIMASFRSPVWLERGSESPPLEGGVCTYAVFIPNRHPRPDQRASMSEKLIPCSISLHVAEQQVPSQETLLGVWHPTHLQICGSFWVT